MVITKEFREAFEAFSTFGSHEPGISLSQSDKWMKESMVIDKKKISTTDTAICFKKLRRTRVMIEDYVTFLKDLATTKHMEVSEIIEKMSKCNHPKVSFKAPQSSTVDRLTDTSKYTGAHKERFDESGKGKGLQGRK